MTRKECARAGLSLRPHPSGQFGDAVSVAGPYQIVFQAERVASVSLKLNESPAGVVVGGRTFGANTRLEQMAQALPGCGQVEAREGTRGDLFGGNHSRQVRGRRCSSRDPGGRARFPGAVISMGGHDQAPYSRLPMRGVKPTPCHVWSRAILTAV
jgi:hypothetical protein